MEADSDAIGVADVSQSEHLELGLTDGFGSGIGIDKLAPLIGQIQRIGDGLFEIRDDDRLVQIIDCSFAKNFGHQLFVTLPGEHDGGKRLILQSEPGQKFNAVAAGHSIVDDGTAEIPGTEPVHHHLAFLGVGSGTGQVSAAFQSSGQYGPGDGVVIHNQNSLLLQLFLSPWQNA
jgi:hypothetical protein